jgi:glycosyltransferase involved in cell wall biosynthesis
MENTPMNAPQPRIKVVHIVTRMNTGGVAVLISELVSGLDSNKYEAHLITGRCSPDEEDYIQARGITLGEVSIPSMSRSIRPLTDMKAFLTLTLTLRRLNPDIVHTHTSKAGLMGRVASRIATPHAKVVHTFHGHLLQGYFSKVATRALIFTERNLARISDVLVSMGNEVKKNLLEAKIGKDAQYVVAFPGVKSNQPDLKNQQVLKFREAQAGQVILTFVGRLSPIKRCDRILELVRSEEIARQPIHFLVIGDGELREELELQSAGLPVTFVGWQSNIEDWLAASDAAILLSDNEAVPLALIEASYAGLPVIATNVGSMSDVVINEVNGYLVETNIDDITEKVLLIAKDANQRELMGGKGRELAIKHFSVAAMISKHEEIYSQLMNRLN